MRILVLGASGGVGWLVVEESLKRRYEVSALARSLEKLAGFASRIRIVQGDALDARVIEQAVTGLDVVIYALGAGNVRHATLFSESTRVLLTAARVGFGPDRLPAVFDEIERWSPQMDFADGSAVVDGGPVLLYTTRWL